MKSSLGSACHVLLQGLTRGSEKTRICWAPANPGAGPGFAVVEGEGAGRWAPQAPWVGDLH